MCLFFSLCPSKSCFSLQIWLLQWLEKEERIIFSKVINSYNLVDVQSVPIKSFVWVISFNPPNHPILIRMPKLRCVKAFIDSRSHMWSVKYRPLCFQSHAFLTTVMYCLSRAEWASEWAIHCVPLPSLPQLIPGLPGVRKYLRSKFVISGHTVLSTENERKE